MLFNLFCSHRKHKAKRHGLGGQSTGQGEISLPSSRVIQSVHAKERRSRARERAVRCADFFLKGWPAAIFAVTVL